MTTDIYGNEQIGKLLSFPGSRQRRKSNELHQEAGLLHSLDHPDIKGKICVRILNDFISRMFGKYAYMDPMEDTYGHDLAYLYFPNAGYASVHKSQFVEAERGE
jgi:hypothetical protein